MTKKLKPIRETSRGGRREVLVRNDKIRETCEIVSRQTGYPFQKVFDELIEMFVEGYVFGERTSDVLFNRILAKKEQKIQKEQRS